MPKKISADERAKWRNIWCILRSLDKDEVEAAEPGRDFDWPRFRDAPQQYLIRADAQQADGIWRAVEKRLK